ncbi:hypothetical protein [Actinoplanes sp. G11-F43]|uniref:hypothetical protein n=1 Tax=Actinoplanes sp. G11-F43 TaxID=3424130 RepID=UPI003D32490D
MPDNTGFTRRSPEPVSGPRLSFLTPLSVEDRRPDPPASARDEKTMHRLRNPFAVMVATPLR